MSSARTLSRVVQSLGGFGLLALSVAVVVALDASVFHAPPPAVRLAAGVAGVVLLAASLRALGTMVRLVRRERALRRRLRGVQATLLAGRSVLVVPERRLVACCVGWWSPRVVVSTGALEALSGAQVRAVVAHEDAHARRRDPLRLLAASVTTEALSFLPGARLLGRRYGELLEVAADERAVGEVGRAPLAAALVAFSDHSDDGTVRPSPGRIDGLLGMPMRIADARLVLDGAVLAGLVLAAGMLTMATGCLDVVGQGGVCGEQGDAAPLAAVLIGVASAGIACATGASRRRFQDCS